ncbi:MAG: TIM barrel protein [Candidatus Woesearchaeota archaeon]
MILLGPAGSPLKSTIEGISEIRKLGLQAMEVEFTHGIKMSDYLAKEIFNENKNYNVVLSVHAPYFINLASEDSAKKNASVQRILKSCELGNYMGAKSIVFHAAYYGKNSEEKTYDIVKEAVFAMQEKIEKNSWNVELCPETTGKKSEFGTLEELLRLRKETKCGICIDFAHILARNKSINYKELFDKIERAGIKKIHSHFSGIVFGDKGEKHHRDLSEDEILPLAKEILKRNIGITIICESPSTWRDALKIKSVFEGLGYKFNQNYQKLN